MRLHLSIQRYGLPAVDIVFSTSTGTDSERSSATISDLLRDVNDLVPLESADGERRLGDYVVEIPGKQKADGKKRPRWYECLHFQSLVTVLKDDDEVVIRAMEPEDLRTRRIGGRVQTTGDGRHLVDGVAWDRKCIAGPSQKAEVDTSPRKKRKLITAGEPDGASLRVLQRKEQVDGDSISSSGSSDSGSTSDSDSDSDSGLNPDSNSDSNSASDSGSDSGSSSVAGSYSDSMSNSDSDSDSGSEDSSIHSSSSATGSDSTSSSGSESSLESDSASSEESKFQHKAKENATPLARAQSTNKLDTLQVAPSTSLSLITQTINESPKAPTQNPPGTGLPRTRRKNERVKMKKRLKTLQESGQLPVTATFADLKDYENAQQAVQAAGDAELAEELEVAKARLLKGIEEAEAEASAVEAPMHDTAGSVGHETDNEVFQEAVEESPAAVAHETISNAASPDRLPEQGTPQVDSPEGDSQSPAKRAKLNVAASRRLLFGSLGLRTPKNAAEEQALRERLSQINRPKEVLRRATVSDAATTAASKSWKDKLAVTAVECVQENLMLPPPPFPFVQHWHREGKAEKPQEEAILNYDESASPSRDQQNGNFDSSKEGYPSHEHTNVGAKQEDRTAISESRTVSFDKDSDDLPIPTNFESLVDLDRSRALPGTFIAYKELHVGADTNFQPQVSAYRVAKIESIDADDWVTVRLSQQDRRKNVPLDPETGEDIPNNFEIEYDDDNEDDDGLREIAWAHMLEPKLVQSRARVSQVQVEESATQDSVGNEEDSAEQSQQKSDDGIVPESLDVGAAPIEIGTPRRKEISSLIREAGFDSAMDEQLAGTLLDESSKSEAGSHQPSPGQAEDAFIETSRIAIEEEDGSDGWNSSRFHSSSPHLQTDGNIEASMQDQEPSFTPPLEPSSSPSVSLQLTVEYPRVSLLEGDETSTPKEGYTRNSSSHQDAQRVPPVPASGLGLAGPSGDEVGTATIDGPAVQAGEDGLDSLSPRGAAAPRPREESEEDSVNSSFLGRHGSAGRDSSHLRGGDDSDISSLPSLSALTSTQQPKKAKTRRLKSSQKKKTGDQAAKPSKGAEEVAEDEEAGQVRIKISASQGEQPRSLGGIPQHGIQTIDLTRTSSPVGSGNSDSEFHPEGLAQASSGESRSDSRGRRQTRASRASLKAVDNDPPGFGLGKKRLLTTRKRSKAAGGYF